MPILIGLSIAFQAFCLIHAIRTKRDNMWFYIILLFPGIGSAVYFFAEMLPDLKRSRKAKQVVRGVMKSIDPQLDLRRASRDLRMSDNVDNKLKLAEQCIEQNIYEEAEELYESCLNGVYQHDPNVLLKLAEVQFLQDKHAQAKTSLDRLIKENPEFKSQEGHLLYARCLEALEDTEAALEEYKVLDSYYSGAEAKCRYALLLKKQGMTEKAHALFQEITNYAKDAPSFYRKAQKTWITMAKDNLS